jgi:hypothetical protein
MLSFIDSLTSNPALTDIELDIYLGDETETDSALAPVKLSNLVGLNINLNYDEMYTRAVLSAISSPALVYLILNGVCRETLDAIIYILRTSYELPKYPVLTHLELACIERTEITELGRDFVDALPTITHLSFSYGDSVDSILAALVRYGIEGTVPWPNLQAVTLPHFFMPESIPVLRDFVAARILSGHPLEMFKLEKALFAALSEDEYLRDRVWLELI